MTPNRPSIVPHPEVVRRRPFDIVARYHCSLGCGWWHDESADPGPVSLILPIGYTMKDVDAMLTLNAEARDLAIYSQVEQAISAHFRDQHPSA
jgi:hypothetical protein